MSIFKKIYYFFIIDKIAKDYIKVIKKEGHKWTRLDDIVKKGDISLYVPKFPFLFFLIGFDIPSTHFNLIEKAIIWYTVHKYIKKEIK